MHKETPIPFGPYVAVLALWLLTGCTQSDAAGGAAVSDKTRVALIGASIGQGWDLPHFPARVHDDEHLFESFAVWQFDKSEALEEILMRPARRFKLTRTYLKSLFEPPPKKPDALIIKECSSYFPGDLTAYQASVKKWIRQAQDAGIRVMVATVAPVTRSRAERDKGKMEGILAYNDWIRMYAQQEKLPILDLEAALRDGASSRFLRDDLTSGDGSHLNRKAYDLLDRMLMSKLCELDNKPCAQRADQGTRQGADSGATSGRS